MIYLIESLKKVLVGSRFLDGDIVKDRRFGGFCNCGGIMFQKIWVAIGDCEILISECEKCWKNQAYIFNSKRFIRKEDVNVITRDKFKEYLQSFLELNEFTSLINALNGYEYDLKAFESAKNKLEALNLKIDEISDLLK